MFHAIDNEEVSNFDLEDDLIPYDELLSNFYDLHDKFEKLASKYNVLKKKNASLEKELESTKKGKEKIQMCTNCSNLDTENKSLKEKVLDLTNIVHNFTNGKKNFDLMLGKQKCVFDKGGLGYRPCQKQKFFKNYFVKGTSSNNSKIVCNYCNQDEHSNFFCYVKKNA